MEQKIPTPDENHGECPPGAGPEMEGSFQRFKEKMERAATISKKKSASAKKAKAKDRLTSHVKSFETLRRGQRYLGLRPQDRKGGLPVPDASLSWDEQQKFEREQKIKYGHILKPLGLEKPAPHPFNRDVVFVAIDVEAYERAHDLITEVGISTLDTVDIKNVEPGHGGFNWMERIRSRHFRIIENQHYINTDYCVGDPEKFLFGQSEFVSIKDIGKMVDSCFEPPYSGGCMHDGRFRPQDQQNCNKLEQSSQESAQEVPESPLQSEPVGTRGPDNAEEDQANKAAVSKLVTPSVSNEAVANGEAGSEGPLNNGQVDGVPAPDIEQAPIPLRNVILVGHNLEADLGYLSTLESKIFHKPPPVVYPQPLEPEDPLRQHILESLDTAKLYQVYQRESNTTSLNKVLVAVERTGWYLHNAGNDARYTLEAMIGILIRARLQEDEAGKADGSYDAQQQAEEEQLARRIREKQELVEREERENAAMWKHAIGPFGEGRKQEAVLPDPYVPTNSAQSDSKKDKDLITSETAASPSLTNGTNTQKVESYPWSTIPPSSRDGGEPNGFKMPETKEKSNLDANGEAKVSSRTKKREEVLRLQEEGEIGGPCDWSVGGKDGW